MTAAEDDPRLIVEAGQEARVANIVEPVVTGLGYRLVRIRLTGHNGATLQIMAERPDGTMTVEDCEILSRDISPALDVDEPISGGYHLEVSSPGIDRPLVRRGDFVRWSGHEARIALERPYEGRRKFRGRLTGVSGDSVGLVWDAHDGKDAGSTQVQLADIEQARLVLTDKLINATQAPEDDDSVSGGANDNNPDFQQA